MTTRARHAAACAGSAALGAVVPTWLAVAGLLLTAVPGAALPAALAIASAFFLPAAVVVSWLERRLDLDWAAPLLLLELSTISFAAAFAYWAFPAPPNSSGTAAAFLIGSGPVIGLGLHGLVFLRMRAGHGGG